MAVLAQGSGQIRKQLLADLVFDRLLEVIITGVRKPGDRLLVDDLAVEFGVSRTPVREALSRLSWERFVLANRNTQTLVAKWDCQDMADRLDILGRMLPPMVQASAVSTGDLASELATATDPGADVQVFLEYLCRVAQAATSRVAGHTVADLIRPLRVFYTPTALANHRLELPSDSRSELLARILSHTDDSAVTDYITELAGTTRAAHQRHHHGRR